MLYLTMSSASHHRTLIAILAGRASTTRGTEYPKLVRNRSSCYLQGRNDGRMQQAPLAKS